MGKISSDAGSEIAGTGPLRSSASRPTSRLGRWFDAAGMALAATMALAACAADGGETQLSPTDTATPTGNTTNLPYDFDISLYQGESILGGTDLAFSDVFSVGKPVVLNLWAGLCPPCRAEMPDFQTVYEEHEDEIVLFALDVGQFTGLGTREDGVALLEELGITFPAGATEQSEVISKYGVLGMPSTYFIKPDGTIQKDWTGPISEEKFRELVTELIAAS